MTRNDVVLALAQHPIVWVVGPGQYVEATVARNDSPFASAPARYKRDYLFITFHIITYFESGGSGGPTYHFELFGVGRGKWQVIGTGETYTVPKTMLRDLAKRALALDASFRLRGDTG